MAIVRKGAEFDRTGCYRYSLWREWNLQAPVIAFIMLNPSTADATADDPTIRRCIRFAQVWGYGSLEVVNLFAYRATHLKDLRGAVDPIGEENDRYLQNAVQRVQTVLLAWGNWGSLQNRSATVMQLLQNVILEDDRQSVSKAKPLIKQSLTASSNHKSDYFTQNSITFYCLGKTKLGHPRHPLYVRGDVLPLSFEE
jgi:hypothetical protein